jgi:hypothetical protein
MFLHVKDQSSRDIWCCCKSADDVSWGNLIILALIEITHCEAYPQLCCRLGKTPWGGPGTHTDARDAEGRVRMGRNPV